MKNSLKLAAAVSLISLGSTLNSHAGVVDVVPGRLLVKPAAGGNVADVLEAARGFGGDVEGEIPALNIVVLRVPDQAMAHALEGLQHNPNIDFAEPDAIFAPDAIPNDPSYGSQWHLPKIKAPLAWDSTAGNNSVVIAVLDTGVDSTHPDLVENMVSGWNTYDDNADSNDVHGHGTRVSGTAAASINNGVGVAGVAGLCRVMPVRISDLQGYGYSSTIAQGLTWAADHGARVANISYNVSASSAVISAAQYFQSKGGVVAIAAGNDGAFSTSLDNPYALTVSATDSMDALASWSNTGNNVDIAAPGVSILQTVKGGGYGTGSGTSFSSPVVAGVAALVISANPALTGEEAANILKSTADDLGVAGWDTSYGAGRVNAQAAVALALQMAGASTPAPAPAPAPSGDSISPVVVITSPSQGSSVSKSTTVNVNATDNVGVTKVELYVDGKLTVNSTTAPFSLKWNTTKVARGSHVLQTKAFDAAGNSATSASLSVTVK